MRKSFLSVVLACCFVFASQGQEEQLSARKAASNEAQIEATRHIDALKSGTLIVRISSGQKKRAAMQLRASKAQLKKFKSELYIENKELVEAFLSIYTFSKVLFIYDNDTDLLLSETKPNVFVNPKTLKVDKSITLNEKEPYYILETERIYFETQNSSSTGFVVLDKDLNYLKDPFPYYIMRMEGFITQKSITVMVEKLEKKLTEFYAMYGTKY